MYDTGRPATHASNGMIATPHHLASSAGLDVLRDGGSAVDAAIAANTTLCVVYPHMAGLGGDGFWLLGDRTGSDIRAINASGPAGKQATRDYYLDQGYEEIPDRGSSAALTVPGAIDGWRLAHDKYGNLSWKRLFADAITHAREGFPISENLARWIVADQDILLQDEKTANTFAVKGSTPTTGTVIKQPDLADTLEIIATEGPRDGFYDGDLAERFCEGLGEQSPLRPTDLSEYTAKWVEPLSIDYRGYTAHSLPPNTQGIAALQILGLISGFDISSLSDSSADYYHCLAEAVKVAFADRDAWVTDPEAIDFPAEELLSETYLDKRRELISMDSTLPAKATPGIDPDGPQPIEQSPGGDTVYFSVVDSDGLAVSSIQSIYFDFGSGFIAGDTGIIPQNRGSFFSLSDRHINRLEPKKRTFHTLTPAMLTQNDTPKLVYGTMGGEGQPQTQAALITRLVDFDYDVQTAIEAPRWLFGRTWGATSRSLSVEGRVSDSVVNELKRRGQSVTMAQDYDDTMGHAAAIRIYEEGMEGGADPRGDGIALGY